MIYKLFEQISANTPEIVAQGPLAIAIRNYLGLNLDSQSTSTEPITPTQVADALDSPLFLANQQRLLMIQCDRLHTAVFDGDTEPAITEFVQQTAQRANFLCNNDITTINHLIQHSAALDPATGQLRAKDSDVAELIDALREPTSPFNDPNGQNFNEPDTLQVYQVFSLTNQLLRKRHGNAPVGFSFSS